MPVPYILIENNLKPGSYSGRILKQGEVGLEGIVDEMMTMGSTTTRGDILAVLHEYERAVTQLLSRGIHINTPFMRFQLALLGEFDHAKDLYDKSRHSIKAKAFAGTNLLNAITRDVHLTRVVKDIPRPVIRSLEDFTSGLVNQMLTPGGLAEVCGRRLKFEQSDAEQGVFFKNLETGQKYRASAYSRIRNTVVILQVPELPPGEYNCLVRTVFGSGRPREATNYSVLAVASR